MNSHPDVLAVLDSLPQTLRAVRILRGLSLRETAKRAGVSFSTVTRAEQGADLELSSVRALLVWIGGEQP